MDGERLFELDIANCQPLLAESSIPIITIHLASQFKPAPVSSMMDENLAAYGSRRMIGAIDVVVSMARWVVCVVDERLLWRSMRLGAAILWRSKRWQPEIEPDGSGSARDVT